MTEKLTEIIINKKTRAKLTVKCGIREMSCKIQAKLEWKNIS